MVDVNAKAISTRTAHARSVVHLPDNVSKALKPLEGNLADVAGPKGAVFNTAIIAGVCGAKKTSDLIPFCHPLSLEKCDIDIRLNQDEGKARVIINCHVALVGKTGVEMEALVGASTAALCVYDMLKAMSHDIVIGETRLVSKTGGKRDFQLQDGQQKTTIPADT